MCTSERAYFVYIVTNPGRSALYIGVTNNLQARLNEHWGNRGRRGTFAGRYFCYNLIYYESFRYINVAIAREKELKKWNREKKEILIKKQNPHWLFLNARVCGRWPPEYLKKRF
ncbi:MAG: GIY-YIG nuclease family protein [Chitinophagaceae bacterium]|nr:GIY-YIG nuclease family protein [Chitinophagaceae bacterium]